MAEATELITSCVRLLHHSDLVTTLTSNPLLKFGKFVLFEKFTISVGCTQSSKCSVKTKWEISPFIPLLVPNSWTSQVSQLFEKLLKEEFFVSNQSNLLPQKEQYRDISVSVTFSKGHTHWCPVVCDGHGTQGTTSHLLFFLDTFHHESVCKAPSADYNGLSSQMGACCYSQWDLWILEDISKEHHRS